LIEDSQRPREAIAYDAAMDENAVFSGVFAG
jgi:hypothetical protein